MIQNISVIPDRNDSLNELIKATHFYYPVGFDINNEQYDGFKILKNILEKKIGQLINSDMPDDVKMLEENIKESFPGFRLYFDFHRQFPSYSISIELKKNESEELESMLLLTLKISLLTDYYTVFYEEYTKYKTIALSTGLLNTTIIALTSKQEYNKESNLKKINELIQISFPSHKFINHDFLFDIKISQGTPLGEDYNILKKEYPVYNFLFDNQFYINLQVLK